MDSIRQFQITGVHTLKARLANAVLVDGIARRVWDADRNDMRCEPRLYRRCSADMDVKYIN